MSNDGGNIALIEAAFVTQLAALELDSVKVFRTAEHWRHQTAAGNGGIEAFDKYAPFAFVKHQPRSPSRVGGYDLNAKVRIAIAIGVKATRPGDARIGTAAKLGASKIFDLVLALFEDFHPGDGFTCDDFAYVGDAEIIDDPQRYGIELYFEADYIRP